MPYMFIRGLYLCLTGSFCGLSIPYRSILGYIYASHAIFGVYPCLTGQFSEFVYDFQVILGNIYALKDNFLG